MIVLLASCGVVVVALTIITSRIGPKDRSLGKRTIEVLDLAPSERCHHGTRVDEGCDDCNEEAFIENGRPSRDTEDRRMAERTWMP
jgi:hypothetical protein